MTRRLVASIGLAAALTLVALPPRQVAGQSAAAPPLAVTAYNGGPPFPYTVPRTPWGDPDIQGTWSSDDTAGIPLNRQQRHGTDLYLNDTDWAARQKQIEGGVANLNNEAGAFRGDFARRAFRQTSLIVDPADGRM